MYVYFINACSIKHYIALMRYRMVIGHRCTNADFYAGIHRIYQLKSLRFIQVHQHSFIRVL